MEVMNYVGKNISLFFTYRQQIVKYELILFASCCLQCDDVYVYLPYQRQGANSSEVCRLNYDQLKGSTSLPTPVVFSSLSITTVSSSAVSYTIDRPTGDLRSGKLQINGLKWTCSLMTK